MAITTLLIAAAVVFFLLVLVGGAAALMPRLRNAEDRDSSGAVDFLLEAKPYFFTPAENKFYGELVATADDMGLLVFPKVGLNDFLKDKPGAAKGQYNRYAQLHIDFLLVSKQEYRPVAGIELDGASHQGTRQQARDQKKNAAFKAAGLPLLRFINHTTITPAQLRQKLEDGTGLPAGVA